MYHVHKVFTLLASTTLAWNCFATLRSANYVPCALTRSISSLALCGHGNANNGITIRKLMITEIWQAGPTANLDDVHTGGQKQHVDWDRAKNKPYFNETICVGSSVTEGYNCPYKDHAPFLNRENCELTVISRLSIKLWWTIKSRDVNLFQTLGNISHFLANSRQQGYNK
jgi:hypothetical protein